MAIKSPIDALKVSPLRRHAADALRRARKLPIGRARNDLRQLAMGLLWLDRRDLTTGVNQRAWTLDELKNG